MYLVRVYIYIYIYIFHPFSPPPSSQKRLLKFSRERGGGCTAIDLMGVLLAAVKHHIKPSSSLLTRWTKKGSFDKWLLYDRHHSFTGRHGLNSSASVHRFRESPSPPSSYHRFSFPTIFSSYRIFSFYRTVIAIVELYRDVLEETSLVVSVWSCSSEEIVFREREYPSFGDSFLSFSFQFISKSYSRENKFKKKKKWKFWYILLFERQRCAVWSIASLRRRILKEYSLSLLVDYPLFLRTKQKRENEMLISFS